MSQQSEASPSPQSQEVGSHNNSSPVVVVLIACLLVTIALIVGAGVWIFVLSDGRWKTTKLSDEFNGQASLDWEIRFPDEPDDSHISYETNEGALTLTTQKGSLYEDTDTDPPNVFLLKHPVQEKGEHAVAMTIHVREFNMSEVHHHISILFFNNKNSYLRGRFGFTSGVSSTSPAFTVNLEQGGNAKTLDKKLWEDDYSGEFYLRLSRSAEKTYSLSYSRDGKDFEVMCEGEWDHGPTDYVGFVASNGNSNASPDVDIVIESFEIECKDR